MKLYCSQCQNEYNFEASRKTSCPKCGSIYFSTYPINNSLNPLIGIPDDIYEGVLVGTSYKLGLIATVQKLQSEGYFKAASWIEKNQLAYEQGKQTNFVSVKNE